MTDFTDVRRFPRQVHLDFHTSPLIPDVAADFDPDAFADAFADRPRPERDRLRQVLPRDELLSDEGRHAATQPCGGRTCWASMIEALHRRGIRAPIYTTVGFEEDAADAVPAVAATAGRRHDSPIVGTGPARRQDAPRPAGGVYLDFLHRDYQDYIEAHVRRDPGQLPGRRAVLRHPVPRPRRHVSGDATAAFRRDHGLTADDEADVHPLPDRLPRSGVLPTGSAGSDPRPLAVKANIFYNTADRAARRRGGRVGGAGASTARSGRSSRCPAGTGGTTTSRGSGRRAMVGRRAVVRHDGPVPADLGRLRRPQAGPGPGVRVLPQPSPGRRDQRRRPAAPAGPGRPRRLPVDRVRLRPAAPPPTRSTTARRAGPAGGDRPRRRARPTAGARPTWPWRGPCRCARSRITTPPSSTIRATWPGWTSCILPDAATVLTDRLFERNCGRSSPAVAS